MTRGTCSDHHLLRFYRYGARVGTAPRHECANAQVSHRAEHVLGEGIDDACAASKASKASAYHYLQWRARDDCSVGGKGWTVRNGSQESASPRSHDRGGVN